MPEPERSRIMQIRRGEWEEAEVVAEIEDVERRLEEAVAASPLHEAPDAERVNAFVVETYRAAWGWG